MATIALITNLYEWCGHKKTLTGKGGGGNLSGSEKEKMKNIGKICYTQAFIYQFCFVLLIATTMPEVKKMLEKLFEKESIRIKTTLYRANSTKTNFKQKIEV